MAKHLPTAKAIGVQAVKNILLNYHLHFKYLTTKRTKKIQHKAHERTFVPFVKKLRVLCFR